MNWPNCRTKPDLRDNSVHVWSADLDAAYNNGLSGHSLSSNEIERAGRFKFEKDRKRFVAAREILRTIAGHYTNQTANSVSILTGDHGKPFIPGKPIRFNVSHSGALGLFAFSGSASLGVDIEDTARDVEFEDLARRFFAPTESKSLLNLSLKQRRLGFYNCWTRKEAFIKAVGDGLSYPLDSFEVSLIPGEKARLIRIGDESEDLKEWTLSSLSPQEGFVGALVARGTIDSLECYSMSDHTRLPF